MPSSLKRLTFPIDFEAPAAGAIAEAVAQYLKTFTHDVLHDRAGIEGVINRGVQQNFLTLSRGGSVLEAGRIVKSVVWSQARHPTTLSLRSGLGLPPYAPFLDTRSAASTSARGSGRIGKLARAILRGGAVLNRGEGLFWQLRERSAEQLVAVHEFGLARLPSPRGRNPYPNGLQIPARPSIFWSDRMVREMSSLLAGRAGITAKARAGLAASRVDAAVRTGG